MSRLDFIDLPIKEFEEDLNKEFKELMPHDAIRRIPKRVKQK